MAKLPVNRCSAWDSAGEFLGERCWSLSENCYTARYSDERIWLWDGSRHVPLTSGEFATCHARPFLAEKRISSSAGYVGDFVHSVGAILSRDGIQGPPCWTTRRQGLEETLGPPPPLTPEEQEHEWISFRNGILDLDSAITGNPVLVPHNPRWFSSSLLPYDYDPTANCPVWERCLGDWFGPEAQEPLLIQEFMGYCWTSRKNFGKCLVFEGPGANGKGVCTDTVAELIGKDNCSFINLRQMDTHFGMESAIGKLVNICADTGAAVKFQSQVFKNWVTSDPMNLARKYKSDAMEKLKSKLFIAWNERPIITDHSPGFWRRFILIPFNRCFYGREDDTGLREKLKAELPGILNWTLKGLARLYATEPQGQFTRCPAVEHALAEFRVQSDPVAQFLADCYTVLPVITTDNKAMPEVKRSTSKVQLQTRYNQWRKDTGAPMSTRDQLRAGVLRHGAGRIAEGTRGDGPCYWGLVVTPIGGLSIPNANSNSIPSPLSLQSTALDETPTPA